MQTNVTVAMVDNHILTDNTTAVESQSEYCKLVSNRDKFLQ